MATATRFEDLTAWQKARELTREVYKATQHSGFARDFGLAGQIQRAAVSVMSNIAEGFERGSLPDFARFLSIAKASCGEVCSQLYVALDINYIDDEHFTRLVAMAEEVSRIIVGLRSYVDTKHEQQKRKAPR